MYKKSRLIICYYIPISKFSFRITSTSLKFNYCHQVFSMTFRSIPKGHRDSLNTWQFQQNILPWIRYCVSCRQRKVTSWTWVTMEPTRPEVHSSSCRMIRFVTTADSPSRRTSSVSEGYINTMSIDFKFVMKLQNTRQNVNNYSPMQIADKWELFDWRLMFCWRGERSWKFLQHLQTRKIIFWMEWVRPRSITSLVNKNNYCNMNELHTIPPSTLIFRRITF